MASLYGAGALGTGGTQSFFSGFGGGFGTGVGTAAGGAAGPAAAGTAASGAGAHSGFGGGLMGVPVTGTQPGAAGPAAGGAVGGGGFFGGGAGTAAGAGSSMFRGATGAAQPGPGDYGTSRGIEHATPSRTPAGPAYLPPLFVPAAQSSPSPINTGAKVEMETSPYWMGNAGYLSPSDLARAETRDVGPQSPELRANRPDLGLPPTATLYELSSVPEAEPSVLGSYTASRRPVVEPTSAFKPRLAPVLATDAGVTPWVTVFGFPPSLAMSILRDFQAIGDVAQYQPGEGNWMYIKYSTLLDAQKALAANGRVLSQRVMVGVVPTAPADIPTTDGRASTGPSGVPGRGGLLGEPRVDVFQPRDLLVVPRPASTVWTRVMEWLFGW